MLAVDPKLYCKYISYGEKGGAILYVRAHKALYGFLKSALLFYNKLVSDLESHGFEIKPYNPSVAEKTLDRDQLTITRHVNNLKISHIDRKFILSTILWMSSVYGKIHSTRIK